MNLLVRYMLKDLWYGARDDLITYLRNNAISGTTFREKYGIDSDLFRRIWEFKCGTFEIWCNAVSHIHYKTNGALFGRFMSIQAVMHK